MKEKRTLPLIIFIVVCVPVLLFGFYLANALPQKLSSGITDVIGVFNIDKITYKNDAAEAYDINYLTEGSVGSMPKNVNGVWLDLDSDISEGLTYGELIKEASDYFENFLNFLPSVVYIRPDYDGKFDSFKDAYGNNVDVLREYIKYADKYELFKTLVIDGSCIYKNGNLSFDNVRYYLTNYSFDAVLLSLKGIANDGDFLEAAEYFCEKIKTEITAELYFGAELQTLRNANDLASGNTLALLSFDDIDFAVVEGTSTEDTTLSFAEMMDYWNDKAGDYPDVTFYCKHRNDLVCSNSSEWGSYTEICSQVRYLWDCENVKGSVFFSAYSLKRNYRASSQRLSYLLFDGANEELEISKLTVNDDSTVSFYGAAPEGHKVTLNGSVIADKPVFTYDAQLYAGSNVFEFFSAGKTLTYSVYNNSSVIYSVAPKDDCYVNSGETFNIVAVCIDGAAPVCTLNGNTYEMTKVSLSSVNAVPEGYNAFACSIRIKGRSDSELELGRAVISASLNEGTGEKAVTGTITVLRSANNGLIGFIKNMFSNKDNKSSVGDLLYDPDNQISPFSDNGLGTALMCRIKNDDTELLGKFEEKNTYYADNSCLPAGTIDYIKDMSVSEAGYLRYELQSGLTVYGVNCEIINNGFVLPKNGISVSRVDDSKPDSTDVYFNTDWFVPVTVKCKPQNYSNGYAGYSFNISEFTAEYIDIKFYYTDRFYNSSLLSFADDSPFSYAELYSAGDENMLLRVYLRQKGQFYGYDIFMDENGQIVLSFKKHINGDVSGKVIMIDPGHGGLSMTGTSVNDNSVSEEEVTLAISLYLRSLLEEMGAKVIMTRESDIPLTLEDRAEMLSAANPDIFVSIHCDGTDSGEDSGTHSFYFRPYSMPLADQVNKALAAVYKTHIYTPEDENYNRVDKKIKFYPFYVIRRNHCPAILIETGFMTNETEGRLLTMSSTQYMLAQGIADGIKNYFAFNHR